MSNLLTCYKYTEHNSPVHVQIPSIDITFNNVQAVWDTCETILQSMVCLLFDSLVSYLSIPLLDVEAGWLAVVEVVGWPPWRSALQRKCLHIFSSFDSYLYVVFFRQPISLPFQFDFDIWNCGARFVSMDKCSCLFHPVLSTVLCSILCENLALPRRMQFSL